MPTFSTLIQTPEVRAIVQEGYLERAFHDALFPLMLYRGDVASVPWPGQVGDTQIFTGKGTIEPNGRPIAPGVDPTPKSYPLEQWSAQLHQYADTMDTHMPTSVQAIVDLLMSNAHALGLQAAQTLNRLVRNRQYNIAESGFTVANGAASGGSSTALAVKRLNGFTTARNTVLSSGVQRVRFDAVSSTNPLQISIAGTIRNVIAATPDTAGDELGPGTLTLDSAASWSDRAYVHAVDKSSSFFVGGGNKVDDLSVTDLPTLQDIRTAVTRLRTNNAHPYPEGNFHAHIDPESESAMFADTEIQRMNTGRPDSYMYTDFVVGRILGVSFVRNNEAPLARTVYPYDGATFSDVDAFAPELTNNGLTTGMGVHRILFCGWGGLIEYYQDPAMYITEAGLNGRMGDVHLMQDGIEITADHVKVIMRAPQDRLQQMVSTSWVFVGDWVYRTDATAPGPARYKRSLCLLHGGA